MRGNRRMAMAAGALLALTVALTAALAESDTDKTVPPAAEPTATPATGITFLNKHEVEGILGREVRSAADENMGRIVDVLVDRAGQVRAAIIDFGGFLGVGSRKIAVDWNALHFPATGQAGRTDRPRIDPRPGQSGTRIPGRQASGRPGRARQARATARISNSAGDVFCPRNRYAALATVEIGAAGSQTSPRRHLAEQPGRNEAAARAVARAACAGSIGSSSSSPTCRPALGRSSRSFSPRKNGRRSTSASSSRPPVSFRSSAKCRAARSSMPRGRSDWSPASPSRLSASARWPTRRMPVFPMVLSAAVMQALASCVLGPAMAAISLGLVGHAAISERLGRNARFASIGNGLAAAAMGACGYFLSARAVFVVTVVLLVPALLALRQIVPAEIDPERAHGATPRPRADKPATPGERHVFTTGRSSSSPAVCCCSILPMQPCCRCSAARSRCARPDGRRC